MQNIKFSSRNVFSGGKKASTIVSSHNESILKETGSVIV